MEFFRRCHSTWWGWILYAWGVYVKNRPWQIRLQGCQRSRLSRCGVVFVDAESRRWRWHGRCTQSTRSSKSRHGTFPEQRDPDIDPNVVILLTREKRYPNVGKLQHTAGQHIHSCQLPSFANHCAAGLLWVSSHRYRSLVLFTAFYAYGSVARMGFRG